MTYFECVLHKQMTFNIGGKKASLSFLYQEFRTRC